MIKLPATPDKTKNAKTSNKKGNKLATKSGAKTVGTKAPSPQPEQRHLATGAVIASSSALRKPASKATITSTSRSQAWNALLGNKIFMVLESRKHRRHWVITVFMFVDKDKK